MCIILGSEVMRKLSVVSAFVLILSFAAGLAGVAHAQSGTETRITTSTADQFDPSTSGGIIVYSDRCDLDVDIYHYYCVATGREVQLT